MPAQERFRYSGNLALQIGASATQLENSGKRQRVDGRLDDPAGDWIC
jgi:hypothetical protein